MPTKFVTNPRRPAAKKSRVPMRRNYASASTADNYLRDLRPAQVAQMVREGSLAITHADIGNDYHTVTLFEDGAGGNRKRVEAKWFVPGEEWYDLSLGLRDGKVDPSTADLFLGPSGWDKREREEQTRAAAKRKGITIDASRHYFNNPRRHNPDAATPRAFLSVLRSKLTQHDVKLSAKQPNMYRLGHYLAAAERVEKDMGKSLDSTSPAALEKLRQSLHKRFDMPFAPASAVERQIDAYLASGTMPSLVRKNPSRALITRSFDTARSTFKLKPITRKRLLAVVDTASTTFWDIIEVCLCYDDCLNKDDVVVVASKAYMLDFVEKWVRGSDFRVQSNPRQRNVENDRVQRATEDACHQFWMSIELDLPEVADRMGRATQFAATRADMEEFNGEMLKFVKRWYAVNPRRKNPPTGFRIAGPAVKTMSEGLRISKADAQRLKEMMDTGAPRILQAADKVMNGHGVERISGVGGGLMYVNMGDTYDTTLIYDYKTNRFVVSSWGDIVERHPRRFED
jgi:hypothetical protein